MRLRSPTLSHCFAVAALCAAVAGCGSTVPKPQPQTASNGPRETWDVLYMQGKRLGYMRQVERPRTIDGKQVVEIESEMHIGVERFGEKTEPTMSVTTIETPDDRLISFHVESRLGQSPDKITGRFEKGKLVIETNSAGNVRTRTIDWPDDALGLMAVEHGLARQPMQPGERREVRHFEHTTQSLIVERLEAKDYEQTELLSGTQKLLRIESAFELPGQKRPLRTTLWTTRDGELLKVAMPEAETVAYRVTQKEAIATDDGPAFDLARATLVKLSKPLENARLTRRVQYRVELKSGDPGEIFAVGPTQELTSTGPHTAEITVSSVDPTQPSCAGRTGETTDADREANSRIQSDDPQVEALAREAAADLNDAGQIALVLEKLVYEKMLFKRNYSTAFATAAEVAKSLEGDCSEHSVLLAALARACGIPARVAMGLVYAPADQAFAYHMWTEVYLGECWVPLDATFGQGRVSADHLKLADSNLADDTWMAGFLPVAEVIGQLKIEVLQSE
jgi:hypothetical protein